jgi:hypothetical protein
MNEITISLEILDTLAVLQGSPLAWNVSHRNAVLGTQLAV